MSGFGKGLAQIYKKWNQESAAADAVYRTSLRAAQNERDRKMQATPHTFRPIKGKKQCSICGGWADANYHNLELFTDADREREAARQLAEAGEMAAQMRAPLKDVSSAAGIMERDSPLFFGTGNNPGLF